MGNQYQINLLDHSGSLITQVDSFTGFHFYRFVGQIGGFAVGLPHDFPLDYLPIDGLVELNLSSSGAGYRNFMSGIIRGHDYVPFEGDVEGLRVSGAGPNEFLSRRIVGFAAGEAESEKTDYADDMMKEVVSENMDAGDARDLGAFFSVDADVSAGPSITKGFAWRNVLDVLQDISQASKEAGTQVFFDTQRTGPYAFEFRTFTGQLGADKTYSSGGNVQVFSKEFGNIANVSLSRDYSEEVNYVYAGGQGLEDERVIVEVSDADRMARSPYNRREAFQQAVQHANDTAGGITGEGNERLARGRPTEVLSAEILDAPGSRYGIDWEFGDRITAMYQGRSYDGMIYGVDLELTEEGFESLRGFVRAENAL